MSPKGKSIKLINNGKTIIYSSMYEACKKNNINYNKFHQRVIRHKWTIKQALELEKPPKREAHNSIHIKFEGINYKSRRQLCDNYNIDEQLVSLRLRRGWELT